MISTRSLPMYMKEPGEEELVIYRGPTDMEDMPVVQERATDSPDSSINLSRTHTREYGAMPDSPHDMPLLSPDDFNPDADLSGQTLIPPTNLEQLHNRPSFETLMSTTDSDGRDGQSHSDNIPEPTGEAPPYFEVVAMDELNATISRDTQPDEPAPPQPTEAAETVRSRHTQQPSNGSRRRSIFGFLHRNGAASPPPVPNNQNSSSHARTDSSPSMLSIASTSGDGHSRNRSRSNHRPSHSTSNNSVFSLGSTPFRTLSRQRSNAALDNHLNSASMISLDSISAPLTHTLVRTEFTYPKSGPTPEQLKLISSRETFAKFGVPYGRDAIAFHASQSRVDLAPPPAFDDAVAGPSSGPNASGSGVSDQQDSSHSSPLSAAPANASGDVDVAISDSETSDTVADRPSAQVPTPPSEPATGSQSTTGNVDRPAEQIPLPPSPAKSELLSAPHPPPGLSPPPPSGTAPPSSFRLPTGVTNPRSESRASSYLSFATADESFRSASPPASPSSSSHLPQLVIPTTGDDSASVRGIGEVEVSPATTAPSTPRLTSTRHLQEDTDATLTPSTPTGAKTSAIPVH
ncbi:hypothetical protein BXZ70DRAFT_60906 [Cristinia sonorae]|uniref:Uncharacterized protein n=1 Tax=Cristinia sonorae TaxID=1940300 RepID=A0A8K0XRH1_9AGAR|nr:hypothetical protein BXZ70DRAFT_60906 [Cristinia sonorae]